MTDEPNLFNQPEPEPAKKLDPGTKAVLTGSQRARERDLERRRKRIGPPVGEGSTIQQRFERFHAANPHVYDALVKMARQLKARGHTKYGLAALFEVLRWQRAMETDDVNTDRLKLSNDYRSRYARFIEAHEPDLEGFFSMREIRA
jgi:hypothetical protein